MFLEQSCILFCVPFYFVAGRTRGVGQECIINSKIPGITHKEGGLKELPWEGGSERRRVLALQHLAQVRLRWALMLFQASLWSVRGGVR